MAEIPLNVPDEMLEHLATLIAEKIETPTGEQEGFLDVDAAAHYLASTPSAIRSLIKRNAIPHYKAPNGRLLFDRDELHHWVTSDSRGMA